MMHVLVIAALASVALGGSVTPGTYVAPTPAPPIITLKPMSAAVPLVIDGRNLRAQRTKTGYTLSGQALLKDACQASRFERAMQTIFPPAFSLVQFRRPGTMGMMCIQRLTWGTTLPLTVASKYPPKYVTVRTQKRAINVPIK